MLLLCMSVVLSLRSCVQRLPPAQDIEEEEMDRKQVRFSVDLPQTEYTHLCAVQQDRLAGGERISLRALVREALRAQYGAAEGSGPPDAPPPQVAPLPLSTWREDMIRYELLLPPAIYAVLARAKHARSMGRAGRRVSFRTLILEAIHTVYGARAD